MSQTQFDSTLGGITISGQAHHVSAWFVVALRLLMGYVFFTAGWDKLTASEPFDAEGFLSGAGSTASPAAGVFDWMSATPAAVEFVNVALPWGEVLVGLGLLVGAFTRLAALWGAFMLCMIYFGNWTVSNGTIVTPEVVYLLVVLSVAAFGAGRMFGLDAYVERLAIVHRYPLLQYMLG